MTSNHTFKLKKKKNFSCLSSTSFPSVICVCSYANKKHNFIFNTNVFQRHTNERNERRQIENYYLLDQHQLEQYDR